MGSVFQVVRAKVTQLAGLVINKSTHLKLYHILPPIGGGVEASIGVACNCWHATAQLLRKALRV